MAKRYHQSKKARMHEERGQEKYLRGPVKRKYDTLRHEKQMYNDEDRHDAMPEKSGPYQYDRQEMNQDSYRIAGIKGEHYAGSEPRRRQEMADAGMIHEDHRAIANLPQEVMIKSYPKNNSYYTPEDLNDTIEGIDHQMEYDNSQKMRHFFPKKF